MQTIHFGAGATSSKPLEEQGRVMKSHDICPSLWADLGRFSHMSLLFHGWRAYFIIINPFAARN